MNDEERVARLLTARDEVERAEAVVVAEVRAAREARWSWSRIGEVYGVSRQAVWERFAVKVRRAQTLDRETQHGT